MPDKHLNQASELFPRTESVLDQFWFSCHPMWILSHQSGKDIGKFVVVVSAIGFTYRVCDVIQFLLGP